MDVSEAKKWSGGFRHPWEVARFEVVSWLLNSDPVFRFAPGSTVVDIGCGDGYILTRFKTVHPEVRLIGIDPAIAKIERRDDTAGVELFSSLQQAAAQMTQPVTHVLLLDVLEHVPDEKLLLDEVMTSLRVMSGATFLVTVPAFESLFSSHDSALHHYRRYSRRRLCHVLRQAGLHIDYDGYFFMLPLFIRMIQVVRDRLFPATAGRGSDLLKLGRASSNFLRLMTGLLLLDFRCGVLFRRFGISPGGLSVFALCRKSI